MKPLFTRMLSGVLSTSVLLSFIPNVTASAEESSGPYPYTFFAASDADGAVRSTAGNFCVNGSVATNGTISTTNNPNINGSRTEHAGEEMIYIFNKIDDRYFSGDNVDRHTESYTLSQGSISVGQPTEITGGADLTGNISVTTALKALETISLHGDIRNSTDSVLFSKYGDIIIDSQNVDLNGLIYAPFGTVNITAQNLNMNRVVIIADSIVLNAPNVNANYDGGTASFVGNISEPFNVPYSEWHYLDDTDGDGLPDLVEKHYDIDPLNADTDGDLLLDGEELFSFGTDPAKYDTDGNGVSDFDEDLDQDGLSNGREKQYGTVPYKPDTDEDTLTDGDEADKYHTDPLSADTDQDGLDDADEDHFGTDPNDPDTDDNGILDGDEKRDQTLVHKAEHPDSAVTEVKVRFSGTGNILKNTEIASIKDRDVICSDVAGLVGDPFAIESTSQFDTATITFTIDQTKLGETAFDDLLFLWYDEENYKFVELETVLDSDSSTASVVTPHFSKYMVVDKSSWYKAWAQTFNYNPTAASPSGDGTKNNTVLAIDCSGSMDTYDKIMTLTVTSPSDALHPHTCERIKAADGFIDNMRAGDKAAVVLFTSSATTAQSMTNDKDALKAAVQRITSSGGTSFTAAVTASVGAFSTNNLMAQDTVNRVILLTDGQSSISDATLDKAKNKDIKIYTVGLGPASSDTLLKHIAEYTGGEFYKAFTASELVDIYKEIGIGGDFDTTDTDGDGLYDAVEAAGIRLQNGSIITGCDPSQADTDHDGLTDGQEIDPVIRWEYKYPYPGSVPEQYREKQYYFVKLSDPVNSDTDGDGLLDDKTITTSSGELIAPRDPHPTFYDGPEGMWKKHISNIKTSSIPRRLTGWYAYTGSLSFSNSGVEGFAILADEVLILLQDSAADILATDFLDYIGKAADSFGTPSMAATYFRLAIGELSKCFPPDRVREIEAELGSAFLNFKEDSAHVLHSQFNQWQALGGYNNTYDFLFSLFTNSNMDKEKFAFTSGDTEYIFWMWRGDYLNLGAGSEIGIYSRPSWFSQDPDEFDHYFVSPDLHMPMDLFLYDYNGSSNISNLFSWIPDEKRQWWVTGFNPAYAGNVTVGTEITVGRVDMSRFSGLYNVFKDTMNDPRNMKLRKYLYFDDPSETFWVMWGDIA